MQGVPGATPLGRIPTQGGAPGLVPTSGALGGGGRLRPAGGGSVGDAVGGAMTVGGRGASGGMAGTTIAGGCCGSLGV